MRGARSNRPRSSRTQENRSQTSRLRADRGQAATQEEEEERVLIEQTAEITRPKAAPQLPNSKITERETTSEVQTEQQRLASFNMEAFSPQQQELIRRSMIIGSVSSAKQNYNRQTSSLTTSLRNQGQDTFVTLKFFNTNLASQLTTNRALNSTQLPMFGTQTAIDKTQQQALS